MGCGDVIGFDEGFCDYCFEELEQTATDRLCVKCGEPKKECACNRRVLCFSGCASPFYNKGVAKKAMYAFKFRKKEAYFKLFARQMALCVKQNFHGISFDAVCCVPLSRMKRLFRGYNQSEVLAKEIAKILGIPFLDGILTAKYRFATQHSLNPKERFEKLRGIYGFKFNTEAKTVLLVDDIRTTGATLNECAKQLLISGADKVYCVTGLLTTNRKERK
ncbi:MAG: ComF family protein [Clostridia bacterium]|nr:ComF family protein [Clostridia bacterium]